MVVRPATMIHDILQMKVHDKVHAWIEMGDRFECPLWNVKVSKWATNLGQTLFSQWCVAQGSRI